MSIFSLSFARIAAFLPSSPAAATLPARVQISKGATLRIEQPAGVALRCEHGTLWITHDGDSKDVVLEAGMHYRAEKSSRMLVHGLADAEARLAAC